MIKLIDELKVIPGIVGACIVSTDGLQATNLPAMFKPERLSLVGSHLLALSASARNSFSDLTDMTLNYDESVVVARELVEGTVLFAICDPTFNYNLLTMSFNLLQEEFKAGNFSTPATAAPVAATPEQPEAVAAAAPVGVEISASLQELLDDLKSLLSKILGPMAGFVFDDVVEEWQGGGAADFSSIEDLISGINREIGDQDKIDHYRSLIAPLLKSFKS